MKRTLSLLTLVLAFAGACYAGTQYNWGTSFGGGWLTPDDTAVVVGQPVQVTGTGTAALQAGGAPLTLYSRTLAQIGALTPATTGQILFCSNCTNTPVVVSTGSTVRGQWAGVFASTTSGNTSFVSPQ